ncbi:MAG: molybdopterin-guanine dinucleotide biosynthesis protein B, partial [Pseudomonadota bacterium]
MKKDPTPIIGFCAYSGTGKTTFLAKIIPLLAKKGLRLAILKHAHHEFDIDHPNKDSYKLRHAGATQMLISSSRRWALMRELAKEENELGLKELLSKLDHASTDLILVEGFKKEAFKKIELHRPSLKHNLMSMTDKNIVAVATDEVVDLPSHLTHLDLNNPDEIATIFLSDRLIRLCFRLGRCNSI